MSFLFFVNLNSFVYCWANKKPFKKCVSQGHSIRCTESFMRDNVMEELQQMQPGEETKRKMMDILKRFHSEDNDEVSSDDEDGKAFWTFFLFISFL